MTGPKRIQRSRAAGWRMPAGAVYVGRPSKWGNPISHLDVGGQYPSLTTAEVARLVVRDFMALVRHSELTHPNWRFAGGQRGPVSWTYPSAVEIKRELAGRDLACWCPLERRRPGPGLVTIDEACHADVLLALANDREIPAVSR